ncbi:hypothetical protein ACWD25_29110 [Streptomyces sp. NPDC002920]
MTHLDPIARHALADSLDIALAGGCGLCDTEATHMCAACGRCNCHDHTTCTRPTEEHPPTTHTIHCETGPTTVQATSHVPGLLVYRIPDHVDTPSPYRWRLGHHTGLVIACTKAEHEAHAGAHEIANRADWTQDTAELRATLTDIGDLYTDLALVDCYRLTHPAA